MHIPPRHVFFIGPRKTGTTTIYDVLKAQGVRTSGTIKETFFFEKEDVLLDEYERSFGLDPRIPFVEVSPSYFASEKARKNIKHHFPDAWIVVILRDPVKRAISAISHGERIGLIDFSKEISRDELKQNKHIVNIVRTSDFERYVDLWAGQFPGRTIVIRQNAEGNLDPEIISRTAETCGIPLPVPEMLGTRSNSARRSLSPSLVKKAKAIVRRLDAVGLHGVRHILKRMAAPIYRPAPPPNRHLEMYLKEELEDVRKYYDAQPYWTIR